MTLTCKTLTDAWPDLPKASSLKRAVMASVEVTRGRPIALKPGYACRTRSSTAVRPNRAKSKVVGSGTAPAEVLPAELLKFSAHRA